MWYLYFTGGFIVGLVIASILWRLRTSTGTLKIDHSNPEKDIYRICLDKFDNISNKKHILLDVDHNADLSQE